MGCRNARDGVALKGIRQKVIHAAKELAHQLGEPISSGPGPSNSVVFWYDEEALPEIARL
jgi:hypothetical protein